MAEITPNDIVNKEFRRVLRGYDTEEVDNFLQQTSDSLFHVLEENQRLRMQVEESRERITQYQQTEQLIKDALVLAERTADDVRQQARKEADLIRREAEEQARGERASLEDVRRMRQRIIIELRALLQTHWSMLDSQEDRLSPLPSTPGGEGG